MKDLFKIIFIGIITTVIRIICQMMIPAGEQTVLQSSIYVKNGTMPIAFTVYGIIAYSIIASLFLLIRNEMTGHKLKQGFNFALSFCVIWVIYLLEPLLHVVQLDKITYPLADSFSLLILGILTGKMLGRDTVTKKHKSSINILQLTIITSCFVIGRFLQYSLFDTYSLFENNTIETMIWSLMTGIVIALVLNWLDSYIKQKNTMLRVLLVSMIYFGVDLTLFNFFMPLVFDADIPDLILRTLVDIIAITIGYLTAIVIRKHKNITNNRQLQN